MQSAAIPDEDQCIVHNQHSDCQCTTDARSRGVISPGINQRTGAETKWQSFPDSIFEYVFLDQNKWISIEISLQFVAKGSVNNIPALVQIMTWRRPGDKPLSETMIFTLPTHIWVTRPQCVNTSRYIPASAHHKKNQYVSPIKQRLKHTWHAYCI